jgi:hypothetical protein
MLRRISIILFAALLAAALPRASAAEELVMLEEDGCIWCARWNADVGPIYPKTPEGALAPLRRVDINDPLPEDITLTRPAFFTPTFVLVRDGIELARIEGYPGEAFFWGLLDRMLKENTDFAGAS